MIEANGHYYRYYDNNFGYLYRMNKSKTKTKYNKKYFEEGLLQKVYFKKITKNCSTIYNDYTNNIQLDLKELV